jgi:hypothetical protein
MRESSHSGPVLLALFATAAAGLYLGCILYRVVAHLAFLGSTFLMILLHVIGADLKVVGAVSLLSERARGNVALMVAFGGLCAILTAAAMARVFRSEAFRARAWAVSPACVLLMGMLVALDIHLGITPASEFPVSDRIRVHTSPVVQAKLTVEEVVYLKDSQAGVFAETEGVLGYEASLGRFCLDGSGQDLSPHRIRLLFIKGKRNGFSEISMDGKPRYYSQVTPLLGRRVRVIGQCYNGSLQADIADITPLD